ncbi:outer membrane protein assembly factor [Flavobacterium sp. 7A]|uniref:outer membrane protein assembly factor n=1 Tax=Flavobacterium sp. 7A TaxID=2940571 RepID=UPI00222766E9|nr:outer membrane protein assembly factor [Flavobacterium sp. 7A]MCW2119654.1 hypothetical protein [Flavobacterium sp. 7A]
MRYIYFLFLLCTSLQGQVKTIRNVTFDNVKKMDIAFLNKCLQTQANQVLDSTIIQKDVAFLGRLNGIANVTYAVTKVDKNLYDLTFDVVEQFSLIPTLSLWTTENSVAYRVGVYNFNFLGKNNTLGGFYQSNKNDSYGIVFSAPYLFSKKTGLEINAQSISTEEPIFLSTGAASYDYRNSSVEVLGLYQFDIKNSFKVGVNVFDEKYDYLSGAKVAGVPLALEHKKKMLKLIYNFNDLKYDFYLIEGFKSKFQFQYVYIDNDFQNKLLIAWNDLMYFKKVGYKGNWASRLRVGIASNTNDPFAPFSVDNNLNIRGVGNIIDRGTGTIVLNSEFRKTLFEKKWFVLQGNAFVDSGTWRKAGGDLSDLVDSNNVRIYSGLGLRFIHKTIFDAIFRIDYGFGVTKNGTQGLVIGVGQYF